MKANMFLALDRCSDVLFYLTSIDSDVAILGLNSNMVAECFTDDVHRLDRDVLLIPRKITEITEQSFERCLEVDKSVLAGCSPIDTASARRLAKTHKLSVVVVTPNSIRVIDESQINFMHQSSTRSKYIEIHMQPFLKMFTTPNSRAPIEKNLYMLGNVIERALKLDVGTVVSTASDDRKRLLSLIHLDIILFYMGFTKRERRLIIEVYPTELLLTWLSYR